MWSSNQQDKLIKHKILLNILNSWNILELIDPPPQHDGTVSAGSVQSDLIYLLLISMLRVVWSSLFVLLVLLHQ